jgi:hypothetical protein
MSGRGERCRAGGSESRVTLREFSLRLTTRADRLIY